MIRCLSDVTADVAALCWRSRHREANGLVIALFDNNVNAVGLKRLGTMMLLDHPFVDELLRRDIVTLV